MTESKTQPPQSGGILRAIIKTDAAVSLHIYTFFQPILPFALLKSLELSGDGRLFFPVILSTLLITNPLTTHTITAPTIATLLLFNLLLGALLDLLVIGLLKHLIQRPRPVYNKNMFLSFAVDHWSFPSGHSSRVSFIATLFSLNPENVKHVLLTNLKFDEESLLVRYFVVLVGLWASITSISRVLLGRHFVLDVVIGTCLGVLEGVFVSQIFNYENLSSFFR